MTTTELIEKLKAFPPNTEVCILDADTSWHLDVREVRLTPSEHSIVELCGYYEG